MHCPGGNATDPIWRVLASSESLRELPQHSNPNPNPLANQLWSILLESFFTSMLVDGFSFEFEWQFGFRTLLSILADLNNAVVTTFLLTSNYFSPCTNPLVTILRAPITIDITMTFRFHNFLFFGYFFVCFCFLFYFFGGRGPPHLFFRFLFFTL